jgi:ribosomal protein S18 acetylase RimI-like enzyme
MSDIHIREVNPRDYPSIAAIIAEQIQRPESQCIQTSSTHDPVAIEQEIVELYSKDELRFVVADLNGQIVALMGCEFDQSVGRGWTRGPFLTVDQWDSLPEALLEVLLAALPASIRRLDSFLNQEHTRGHRFYLDNGFQQEGLVHVYQAKAANHVSSGRQLCTELRPDQEPAFIDLHNMVFPVTFIDGKGILEQLDQDHKVFVSSDGSALNGYISVSIDKFAGEGYIEFIAVQPELRGRGIGKTLLLCALDWCFSERELSSVGLTVHEELANARGLYESVGFRHLYTGVNTRREW